MTQRGNIALLHTSERPIGTNVRPTEMSKQVTMHAEKCFEFASQKLPGKEIQAYMRRVF